MTGENTMQKIWLMAGCLLLAACSATPSASSSPSQMVSPTTQASSSMTAQPSQSSAVSPSVHAPWDCRGLPDNSHEPATAVDIDKPIYYLFGCDNDQRYVLRITDGIGHLVAAELQSEFSFMVVDFMTNPKLAIQSFSGDTPQREVKFEFTGSINDLHLTNQARVVGPTNDGQAFYVQDCLDYQFMYNSTDCEAMGGVSSSFGYLTRGDAANWINNYGE
jgi:hypothetical protein